MNLVVRGIGARVSVAQASGSGSHTVNAAPARGRSRWRTLGAAAVGLATIVAAVIAVLTWQGWWT